MRFFNMNPFLFYGIYLAVFIGFTIMWNEIYRRKLKKKLKRFEDEMINNFPEKLADKLIDIINKEKE